MIFLGTVVRLQVQRESLKVGERPHQQYDPSPIQPVERLIVDDGGVWGVGPDGERLGDVHHRDHPRSKLRGLENPISVGFTSHYGAMQERFGDHLIEGIAGENILIAADSPMELADAAAGIVIESDAGPVHLGGVSIAEPCAPFTRFCLGMDPATRADRTVTEGLQFLNGGMRGFYCSYTGQPMEIALGNRAFAIA